ncbi:MAG TPA: diacylglycerol kinase family protein [Trueperaceae bacterium]|nr:diacylglycerol kinase family protein [Trueperaceae bacterium]
MLHLIFNPAAGKGRARKALTEALAFLDARAAPYMLHTTSGPGHATELAAASPPGATVVAMGGDGTAHEVVLGLLRRGTPHDVTGDRTLGVLPLGSGDDFAYSLGLSRDDLPAALERLVAGERKRVDLGFVNGEPFLNSVGTGFDAEVAHRVRNSPRFLPGLAGYLYSTLATLAILDCPPVEVWVDGTSVHSGPALLVGAQNGPRTGGSFLFAPHAVPTDGLLDVVVASRLTHLGTLRLLPLVMRGRHLEHPAVALHRGKTVRVLWETPRPGHADGEPLPLTTTFDVSVAPGALPVIA